jgi:hypothetical protein
MSYSFPMVDADTDFPTARLARRRSAAGIDRIERARGSSSHRATYSARAARRASRHSVKAVLRTLTR